MSIADYSRATPEVRQQVIEVLDRNLRRLLKRCDDRQREKLQKLAQEFGDRIRRGEVVRGKDFQILVSLLRGRIPPGV